jgi:tetratricopeptide (TPR) repeat protein
MPKTFKSVFELKRAVSVALASVGFAASALTCGSSAIANGDNPFDEPTPSPYVDRSKTAPRLETQTTVPPEITETAAPRAMSETAAALSVSKPATRAASENLPQTPESEDPLQRGMNLLKLRDYTRALAAFNAAARENPDSAEPHFGRAKALLGLNRRVEAQKEFRLCTLLDSSPLMFRRCNKEMDISPVVPPDNTPKTVTGKDVEKSATRITNQASDHIKLIQTQAQARSESLARNNPAKSIRSGKTWGLSTSSNGDYDQTQNLSASEYLRLNGTLKGWTSPGRRKSGTDNSIKAISEDAYKRSQAVRESAGGLTHAMSTKPSESSGVYLTPHGTNLYVRNYVNFDPVKPEPPESLSAKQLTAEEALEPRGASEAPKATVPPKN